MIKRIRFAVRRPGMSAAEFAAAWPAAVAAAARAPRGVRPCRVVACTALRDRDDPDPKHDGIAEEWFGGTDHLARFTGWQATAAGHRSLDRVFVAADRDASPVIVADELVLRGADWLERRWRAGGDKLKHIAIAQRAPSLTSAELSQRWPGQAGQLSRAESAPVTIPDDVRGRAYAQNYPRPDGDWAYDAMSAAWFDDVAGLRARVAWFRENGPGAVGGGLWGQSWFIAAREVVLALSQLLRR